MEIAFIAAPTLTAKGDIGANKMTLRLLFLLLLLFMMMGSLQVAFRAEVALVLPLLALLRRHRPLVLPLRALPPARAV